MANSTGAGHSELDPGATNKNGTTERKCVVEINKTFRKNNGNWVDVTDYRKSGVNDNLWYITNLTNKAGNSNDWTLSHHMNAFNGKATGVEVWYYAGDSVAKKKAEAVSAAISKELGLPNRGAKATTSLYVVANTYPHCLLIEWCFVDNNKDLEAWNKNKGKAMDAAMKVLGMKPAGTATAAKPKEIIYQTATGWYEALKDDVFYTEVSLKNKTKWKIKKGQIVNVKKVEKTGKYSRMKLNVDGANIYATLRDDFWKKV